jgi:diguanylate cyclase (GGDEF)-like protein/PAS domain S-box-containing protein
MEPVLDAAAANAILESCPDALVLLDTDFVVRWVNTKAVRVFGWSFDEVVGEPAIELVHADDVPLVARIIVSLQREATVGRTTVRFVGPNGSVVSVSLVAALLRDDPVLGNGLLVSARLPGLSSQPATDHVDRVAMFEVMDRLPDAVAVYVPEVGFVFRNRAAVQLFGVAGRDARLLARGSALGDAAHNAHDSSLMAWLDDRAVSSFGPRQLVLEHADGAVHILDVTGSSLVDERGDVVGRIVTFNDVTTMATVNESLHRLAFQDELTGLANRRALREHLDRAIGPQTVVFADLDHFNEINDAFGHNIGDAVLVEVTARLRAAAGGAALVARHGGDEFVIVAPTDEDDPLVFAETLRLALLPILEPPLPREALTASFGVSIADGRRDVLDVLAEADAALYSAKAAGRNCVRRYLPDLTVRSHQHLSTQRVLRDALEASTLYIAFQPIVDVASGRTVSAEALVRIEGSHTSAAALVAAAERTGQIQQIDALALGAAIDLLVATSASPGFTVACNVSSTTLEGLGWWQSICEQLDRAGVAPNRLTVECAERGVSGLSAEAIENLRRAQNRGVRIAIDDFGVEHAGFGVLSALPFDLLKIDYRFVQRSTMESVDRAILDSFVTLARTIGVDLIAEGVETEEQLVLLKELGVAFAQGHLMQPAGHAHLILKRLSDEGPTHPGPAEALP